MMIVCVCLLEVSVTRLFNSQSQCALYVYVCVCVCVHVCDVCMNVVCVSMMEKIYMDLLLRVRCPGS